METKLPDQDREANLDGYNDNSVKFFIIFYVCIYIALLLIVFLWVKSAY